MATLICDLASKECVTRDMTVIPGIFDFSPAENHGAAFSMGSTLAVGNLLFLAISIVLIAFLFWLMKSPGYSKAPAWAFGVLTGGAMGNVYDRAAWGYVRDFLDLHYSLGDSIYHWPVFNVADIGITVGAVVLLGWGVLTSESKQEAPPQAEGKA